MTRVSDTHVRYVSNTTQLHDRRVRVYSWPWWRL